MNFNLQRHMRGAGAVAALIGLYLGNVSVVLVGWLIVFIGYAWSMAAIEFYIEKQNQEKNDGRE